MIVYVNNRPVFIDETNSILMHKYEWHIKQSRRTYYVYTYINDVRIYLHRLIMELKCGNRLEVDHIDHRGFNNQKSNLRICTTAQNWCNKRPSLYGTSRYKGVYWDKQTQKWRSQIQSNNHHVTIGLYNIEKAAALAHDEYARKLHKAFAFLNFPDITKITKNKILQREKNIKKKKMPGTTFDKNRNKWMAQVFINRHKKTIGRYNSQKKHLKPMKIT